MRTADQIMMLYAAYFGGGPTVQVPSDPMLSTEQTENINAICSAERNLASNKVDTLLSINDRYLVHESKPLRVSFTPDEYTPIKVYSKFVPRRNKTKKNTSNAVKQTRKKIASASRKRNRK